ncbi:hypothetical protein BCR39DRAFT_556553 [Naematelia encephala]|uniref:NmrA-like domain-containing protein n=1 Tax=Naematelia encephala TaxID=71784 RepID=A0A1Y2BJV3_9TREE|nr:hypothetical protein BCR39DRAFT_556553 [Naematelia encephala]
MSVSKVIVVFGATGLQGRYLIEALSANNTRALTPWKIIALSRSSTSPSSTALAKLPGVHVVQVEQDVMEAPAKAFAATGIEKGKVYGCVSIQGYVDVEAMYRQGCAIGDAAKEWGVKHFVYSSSDVGNKGKAGIPAFDIKISVEEYLSTLFPDSHTYLRPAHFMEVWTSSDHQFRMVRTVTANIALKSNSSMKHQLVSVRDIGLAGAKAFIEGPSWCDGVVRLAGDGLTISELETIYTEVLWHPPVYDSVSLATELSSTVPFLQQIASFFGNQGYGIDIEACRRQLPEMEDLRAFLIRTRENERTS